MVILKEGMNEMNPWKIDVAVLCIFFARPIPFEKTFEEVRKARPRVLLLWQDGPRDGRPDDLENIEQCRKIAENIDWECEVYQNYHSENMGCDPSTHLAHKWAFSIVDKCIILEDDLVASQSFFAFCKSMLDKYEYDSRISRICGTNLLDKYEIPYDYFFAKTGNSHGWASWKRVANLWETDYSFLEDTYTVSCMERSNGNIEKQKKWINLCRCRKAEGIPYWEEIVGAESLYESQLVIFPSKNMITDIGIDVNSTHAPKEIKELPKNVRDMFNLERYEISFPLKEPKYVIADELFPELCRNKYHSKTERLEGIINKLRYGGINEVLKSVQKRVRRN